MTAHRVGIINTPVKVGRESWAICWGVMADTTSLFGQNEILTRKQKQLNANLCHERGWGARGLWASPNPIYWDRDKWERIDGGSAVVKLHGPGPLPWRAIWPGYNSARSANVVALEWLADQSHHAVINVHLVSAGRKVAPRWRTRVRGSSLEQLADLVAKCTDAGYITWVIGDTNIPTAFHLPGLTWVRGVGIDKIGVAVPDGVDLAKTDWRAVQAPTDHGHGIVARVELNKEHR